MDARTRRGEGWIAFSVVVLVIGGAFAIIDGLMAVYRSRFFSPAPSTSSAISGPGAGSSSASGSPRCVAGFAVTTGSQWARWAGVGVAGLNAVAQLVFAQAYPLWSLMIMTIDFLVIYGLTVYGGRAVERRSTATRRQVVPARTPCGARRSPPPTKSRGRRDHRSSRPPGRVEFAAPSVRGGRERRGGLSGRPAPL